MMESGKSRRTLFAVALVMCWTMGVGVSAWAQNQKQELTEMEKAYNQAVDLLGAGKKEEARSALNAVLTMPVTGDVARARQVQSACWNNLGTLAMLGGDLARGGDAFRKAIELNAANAMALNNLGGVCLKQGRYADAQKQYDAAIRADPRNTEALNNLAQVLIEARQFKSAAKLLLSGLKLDPKNPRTFGLLAQIYHLAKRPEEADALRKGWIQVAGQEPEALAGVVRAYLQHGDVVQAHAVMAHLRQTLPTWEGLSLLDGQLAAAAGEWAAAEKALTAAVAKTPTDAIARNDLVTVLLRSGKRDVAERVAREGTKATPAVSAAWYLLGLSLDAGKDLTGAEAAYRRALELDAGHARAWRNLGVLAALKNQETAVEYFEKALQADPYDRDNQYNLGRALAVSRKDYPRGIRLLGHVAASTSDEVGRKALAFIDELHAVVTRDADATGVVVPAKQEVAK